MKAESKSFPDGEPRWDPSLPPTRQADAGVPLQISWGKGGRKQKGKIFQTRGGREVEMPPRGRRLGKRGKSGKEKGKEDESTGVRSTKTWGKSRKVGKDRSFGLDQPYARNLNLLAKKRETERSEGREK